MALAASLALLLWLAPQSRAQTGDPKRDESLIIGVTARLVQAAPLIDESSTLPGARLLSTAPPRQGPIIAQYLPTSLVDFDCVKLIQTGCVKVGSVACGSENDGFGGIAAGTDIWRMANKNGALSYDRLAWILAHEIGHLRLKHEFQYKALYDAWYKEWYAARGKAYEDTRRRSLAGLSEEDAADDVASFLKRTFENQYADRLSQFSRAREEEADRYADKLVEAAGYSPEEMVGAWSDYESEQALTGPSDKCADYSPSWSRGKGGSHPRRGDRDWRMFSKYYLDGGRD